MQNDVITEFSRMQNNFPNDFNGAHIGVEEGDNLCQEGVANCHTRTWSGRDSPLSKSRSWPV
jgi:hypothetical protein